MSGECRGSFFHVVRGGPVDGGRGRYAGVLEQNVRELVGKRAALSHRVGRLRDRNDGRPELRVAHRHSVLGGMDDEHGDVHTGGLLDDGDEVAERLVAQPVLSPELLRCLPTVGLGIDTHAAAGIA
jgi:hypothetical protein